MNIVGVDIAGTLGGGSSMEGARRGWRNDLDSQGAYVPVCPPLSFALTAKGGRFDGESETFVAHSLRGEGFDASEDGTGRGTPIVPVAFAQNQRDEVRDLGDVAGALAGEPGMKQQTYVAVEQVAETMTTGSGGGRYDKMPRATTPCGVRRLMPIECERLQGMPDHWTRYGITEDGRKVELSDSARYRLIGNSVAVPVVQWIGERIMSAAQTEEQL